MSALFLILGFMISMILLAFVATMKLCVITASPSGLAIGVEPHSEPSRAFPWPKPSTSKH